MSRSKLQKTKSKKVQDATKKAEKLEKLETIIYTVTGDVMVTKNPCSHPGDIRILKAIGPDD